MRAIRTIIKRGDDMPMTGKVMRVKKGLYEVVIKFTKSRRIYHVEHIKASNVAAVKLFFAREYPTLTFGKPRKAKPVKNPIAKDLRTPKYKPRVVPDKRKKSAVQRAAAKELRQGAAYFNAKGHWPS